MLHTGKVPCFERPPGPPPPPFAKEGENPGKTTDARSQDLPARITHPGVNLQAGKQETLVGWLRDFEQQQR